MPDLLSAPERLSPLDATSLSGLHRALGDLVVPALGTDGGTVPVFRLDASMPPLPCADEVDPTGTGLEPQPWLAGDAFRELANRVPRECDEGICVEVTDQRVDQTYYDRMLSPSVPVLPAGPEAARRDVLASFARTKADALTLWRHHRDEPVRGTVRRVLTADRSQADVRERADRDWTSTSVTVLAPGGVPSVDAASCTATFERCVVRIERPWLLDGFLDNPHWRVPELSRGALSDPAASGAMPLLPIGLVLARGLTVGEPGPRGGASSFLAARGPRCLVLGWLLRALPPLPPRGDHGVPAQRLGA